LRRQTARVAAEGAGGARGARGRGLLKARSPWPALRGTHAQARLSGGSLARQAMAGLRWASVGSEAGPEWVWVEPSGSAQEER
jgi:hypothetical protein